MRFPGFIALLPVFGCLACSSSFAGADAGGAGDASRTGVLSATGELAAHEPSLNHAWFTAGAGSDFSSVMLSSAAGACEHSMEFGREPASTWGLVMGFLPAAPPLGPLNPGSYEIGANTVGGEPAEFVAAVQLTDDSCQSVLSSGPGFSYATAGRLTIESVGPALVVGHYSLTFSEGTLAGDFAAPECAVRLSGAPMCAPL
jgi:hypothetical protein